MTNETNQPEKEICDNCLSTQSNTFQGATYFSCTQCQAVNIRKSPNSGITISGVTGNFSVSGNISGGDLIINN